MSQSLKTLKTKVPRRERKRETRDVSKAFGEPEGTVEITWQEPDTAGIFAMMQDAQTLAQKYHWPDSLAARVAEMGSCHVSPRADGDVPTEFYAAIANQNSDVFAVVFGAFRDAFPNGNVEQEVADAKND